MIVKQLQKKFPKAFNRIKKYYSSKFVFYLDLDVREYWSLIADFMDNKKIHMTSQHYEVDLSDVKVGQYVSQVTRGSYLHYDNYKNRKQAETKAIEVAFKLLEEIL